MTRQTKRDAWEVAVLVYAVAVFVAAVDLAEPFIACGGSIGPEKPGIVRPAEPNVDAFLAKNGARR